jgi:glutathione S-transferase
MQKIHMTQTPYRLYARHGAGSLAVEIALEEIGARYELEWIARTPEALSAYRRVNPAGKIPALVLKDGTVMSESAAILIHLSTAYPAARLAPPIGTSAHAQFLQWLVFLSANLYETVLRYYYSERYSTEARDAPAIKAQALQDYAALLTTLDAQLSPYVLGESFSAADPYLYMLAGWYPEDGALLKRLPRLARQLELVRLRPATVKAERDHAEPG